LAQPSFYMRFSFLYLRYETDWAWYECMILLRRLYFAVIMVFMQDTPVYQACVGQLGCVVFLCIHFWARPFLDDWIDILDAFALCGTFCILCSGILFSFMTESSDAREPLIGVVATILLIVTLACAILTVITVTTASFRKTAVRRLTSMRPADTPINLRSGDVGRYIDKELELCHTIAPAQLRIFAKVLANKPDKTSKDYDLIATIDQLNELLLPVIADRAETSVYSRSAKAEFYRQLCQGCPYLIDAALRSPESDRILFGKVYDVLEKYANCTDYSDLIVDADKSSLAHWVARAPEQDVDLLRKVLNSVITANGKVPPRVGSRRGSISPGTATPRRVSFQLPTKENLVLPQSMLSPGGNGTVAPPQPLAPPPVQLMEVKDGQSFRFLPALPSAGSDRMDLSMEGDGYGSTVVGTETFDDFPPPVLTVPPQGERDDSHVGVLSPSLGSTLPLLAFPPDPSMHPTTPVVVVVDTDANNNLSNAWDMRF